MKEEKILKRVEEIKEFALEHYNEGGDVIVECWSDEQIRDFYNENRRNWKSRIRSLFRIHNSRY